MRTLILFATEIGIFWRKYSS